MEMAVRTEGASNRGRVCSSSNTPPLTLSLFYLIMTMTPGAKRNGSNQPASDRFTSTDTRLEDLRARDEMDERMGFYRFTEGEDKVGWMVNIHPVGARFSLVGSVS